MDEVRSRLGKVSNLHATLAVSPAALDAYVALSDALEDTTLDPRLRERLALTVSAADASEYDVAAHTAYGRALSLPEGELARAIDAESREPRVQAAERFVQRLVDKRGHVAESDVEAVRAAGYGDAAILEMVAVTAATIMANYVNRVALTEVDFPRIPLLGY